MLPGQVESTPANARGFDADTPITSDVAQVFVQKGFQFCVRYVSRSSTPESTDLSAAEANDILQSGLALMVVQHVRSPGWQPNGSVGTSDGGFAAAHASEIGFPPGVNVWCDLEGVAAGTSAQDVIDYCNNWYAAVAAQGFVPGLYVGDSVILSSEELYNSLTFQHYWKSLSNVPEVAVRGYQMIQRQGGTLAGVGYDADETATDNLNGSVQWLVLT